jgi:adenylosuccinate synthase
MSWTRDARAVAVVDLGFGDAGKGLITDYLVRSLGARMVVRFNGGAQAGHNVVTPDGHHHTFSQLGSGTFVSGVRTHLSRHVVVHPTALLVEARRLAELGVGDALARLTVSEHAKIVTPFHQAAGRLRELAREERHGSCGVGVGEVMRDAERHPADALRVGDLADRTTLRLRLARVMERVRFAVQEPLRWVTRSRDPRIQREARLLHDPGVVTAWIDAIGPFSAGVQVASDATLRRSLEWPVIFEGAQGVLLDESYGFHPFTTWSNCTFHNVNELLHELGSDLHVTRVGVVRTYASRHGPGPLPTESAELTRSLMEPHNLDGPWQGPFRAGWTDLVLARYAREACGGVDAVALTHVDEVARQPTWRLGVSYDEGKVTDWPSCSPADVVGRWQNTRDLVRAKPVHEELNDPSVEARVRRIASALSDSLRAPIRLSSTGPRATDVRAGLHDERCVEVVGSGL